MPAPVNAATPRIGPIAEVVIATNRLADDRAALAGLLGWRATGGTLVSEGAARRWRAPAAAGARSVALRPPPGAPGAGVRLVEAPSQGNLDPLMTYGWAAFEVLVADVDAVATAVDTTGLAVLGRPAAVGGASAAGTGPGLRAMQIVLPGGAPVYLTEIRAPPARFALPSITSGIGGVFIVVVASPRLEATRDFFEERFALARVTDHPLRVGVLNRAFGLRADSRHRISSVQLAGATAIEIDQYPPAAIKRPIADGHLPPGIAVVEFHSRDPSLADDESIVGPFDLRLAVRRATSAPGSGAARRRSPPPRQGGAEPRPPRR